MAFMRPYCQKEKTRPFKQITDFSTNIFNYCQATAEHFSRKGNVGSLVRASVRALPPESR